MRERFKFKRMLDAACYLLKLNGGKEGETALCDLLYLADREYLLTYGETITGDYPIGTDGGPGLSFTLSSYKAIPEKWREHIMVNDQLLLELRKETDYGDLCQAGCECLERIHKKYSKFDQNELDSMMKRFPEYNLVVGDDPEKFFRENDLEEITLDWLEALRDKPVMIYAFVKNIEMDQFTHELLGGGANSERQNEQQKDEERMSTPIEKAMLNDIEELKKHATEPLKQEIDAKLEKIRCGSDDKQQVFHAAKGEAKRLGWTIDCTEREQVEECLKQKFDEIRYKKSRFVLHAPPSSGEVENVIIALHELGYLKIEGHDGETVNG